MCQRSSRLSRRVVEVVPRLSVSPRRAWHKVAGSSPEVFQLRVLHRAVS